MQVFGKEMQQQQDNPLEVLPTLQRKEKYMIIGPILISPKWKQHESVSFGVARERCDPSINLKVALQHAIGS